MSEPCLTRKDRAMRIKRINEAAGKATNHPRFRFEEAPGGRELFLNTAPPAEDDPVKG